jgi:peroxiredoxin Q/BCP
VLKSLDATLWGISSQDIASHKKFQSHRGLTFPLLADTDNAVFAAYGLGRVTNRRALFVVDADGRIAYAHVHKLGLTYQKVDQIADVLRGLTPPPAAYPTETKTPRKNTAR